MNDGQVASGTEHRGPGVYEREEDRVVVVAVASAVVPVSMAWVDCCCTVACWRCARV